MRAGMAVAAHDSRTGQREAHFRCHPVNNALTRFARVVEERTRCRSGGAGSRAALRPSGSSRRYGGGATDRVVRRREREVEAGSREVHAQRSVSQPPGPERSLEEMAVNCQKRPAAAGQ